MGWGNCWVSSAHSSLSVLMGILVEREVEIWVLDQISGPPMGWSLAVRRVAMLLETIEGQSGDPSLWEWKANSKGQCRNLEAALCRDARAVMPRAPSSLLICVHDRRVDQQKVFPYRGDVEADIPYGGVEPRSREIFREAQKITATYQYRTYRISHISQFTKCTGDYYNPDLQH